MTYRLLTVAALALAANGFAVPVAFAQSEPSVAVHYGDLDLSTEPGRRQLQRRLHGAVGQLCSVPDSYDLRMMQWQHRCRKAAMASAAPQVAAAQAKGRPRTLALNGAR